MRNTFHFNKSKSCSEQVCVCVRVSVSVFGLCVYVGVCLRVVCGHAQSMQSRSKHFHILQGKANCIVNTHLWQATVHLRV